MLASVLLRVLIGLGLGLLIAWIALAIVLLVRRPEEGTAREALRVLPDTIGLLRRITADRAVDRGVRIRLGLLLAYLLFPVDVVPDFLPVIGYADDVVIVGIALRSVIRRAGPQTLRRHWRGTEQGLLALWAVAGLPGAPPEAEAPPGTGPPDVP